MALLQPINITLVGLPILWVLTLTYIFSGVASFSVTNFFYFLVMFLLSYHFSTQVGFFYKFCQVFWNFLKWTSFCLMLYFFLVVWVIKCYKTRSFILNSNCLFAPVYFFQCSLFFSCSIMSKETCQFIKETYQRSNLFVNSL